MTDAVVLAVDVGGTKLAVGLVDESGQVLESRRMPTPALAPERALTELIDDLVGDEIAVAGVGIGCGGPMSWPAGRVSPVNIPAWRDFALRDLLTARFPGRPVRLLNDAICLAIAEHWQGAGRGVPDLLGMVISTGVGGGLVLGNAVVAGRTGNAGHIGHVVVDPDGPSCGCGGRGCLEAIARGPALVAWARNQGWSGADGRQLAAAPLELSTLKATTGIPAATAAQMFLWKALSSQIDRAIPATLLAIAVWIRLFSVTWSLLPY